MTRSLAVGVKRFRNGKHEFWYARVNVLPRGNPNQVAEVFMISLHNSKPCVDRVQQHWGGQ